MNRFTQRKQKLVIALAIGMLAVYGSLAISRTLAADDAILELDSASDIIDGSTGDVVSILSFFVRLTGKEKDMALKSAKLQSISGASTVDVGIAFCYGLLQFKGKLKALAKVPTEVFNAVFPP